MQANANLMLFRLRTARPAAPAPAVPAPQAADVPVAARKPAAEVIPGDWMTRSARDARVARRTTSTEPAHAR